MPLPQKYNREYELPRDIVKVGCWINHILEWNKLDDPIFSPYARGCQIVLSMTTISAQIGISYLLFDYERSLLDTDNENCTSYKDFSEQKLSLQFSYVLSCVILVVIVHLDVKTHIHSLIDIMNGYVVQNYGVGVSDFHHFFQIMMLVAQIFQSIMITYVAFFATIKEDNIKDIMMNFAGLLVVREFDNYVGELFLSQLAPLEKMMTQSYEEKDHWQQPPSIYAHWPPVLAHYFSKYYSNMLSAAIFISMMGSLFFDLFLKKLSQDFGNMCGCVVILLVICLFIVLVSFCNDSADQLHEKMIKFKKANRSDPSILNYEGGKPEMECLLRNDEDV